MMGGAFREPAHREAAAIIVAAATGARGGYGHRQTIEAFTDGTGRLGAASGPLDATDVAEGATVLLERIVQGVGVLLNIDPDETLAQTGRWVAQQEA